jgi:hypothetical protein
MGVRVPPPAQEYPTRNKDIQQGTRISNKEQGMMNCEVNNTSKLDIPCSSVGYSSWTSEIN